MIRDEEPSARGHLDIFKGFYTYLGGFNQNRTNYYDAKSEKATAIATRIVDENLPRFTENVFTFEEKEDEYLHAHAELVESGKAIVSRDGRNIDGISKELFAHDWKFLLL